MMIRACLCLLAGLFAPQLSSFAIDSDLGSTALVAGVVALAVPALRVPGLTLVGGALFVIAANGIIDSRLAPELAGDSIMVQVVVTDFPRAGNRSLSFIARPLGDSRLPPRLRISWFRAPVSLRIGDRWRLELRLRRPRGTANPGIFDSEAWLFRESIGAVAYVADSHRNQLLRSGPDGILDSMRQRFVDRALDVASNPDQAAVLAALVVGTRHLVTDAQWDRYARTGTSHLMAISGLHIGLAASGGYLLACVALGLSRFGGNQHHVAVLVAVLFAVAYALISGGAVPARRAVSMLTVAAVIVLCRRRPIPALVVTSACVGMVLVAPIATMLPGFKLSFAAVVILLWVARRGPATSIRVGISPAGAWPAAQRLGTLQLLLLCGLLPLLALEFGRVSIVAPLVNLLAVPVFSLLTVPLALLGFVLAGPLRFAGDPFLYAAAQTVGWIDMIMAKLALLSWSAPDIALPTGIGWLFLWLPVTWILLPQGWPCRCLGWVAALALILHVPRAPASGCVEARVLDVGQGLAALVRTRSTTLLFDSGPAYRSGGSAAVSIVLPHLARLHIDQIDHLVISHSDSDHAGGVIAILDAVDVSDLIVGELLEGVSARQRRCNAQLAWQADGVRYRFLHPQPDQSPQGNDASCVLQVEAGEHRLLLTGDIERAAEEAMLAGDALQSVDVLTVPHHGSRTSSSAALVAALRPAVAIVSNGFGNRWGLPKTEIVARWEDAGADVLQTAEAGAISIGFCAQTPGIELQQHRKARHRIWHE